VTATVLEQQRDTDALAPVRQALLRQAREEADETRASAEREAQEVLARAHAEADEVRRQARADGERDAQDLRAEQQARARRRARAIVLQAQQETLERLTEQVRARAQALWEDPETRALLRDRLTARARDALGPDATVSDHPAGGVQAEAGSRRVTYLLTDLADETIAGLPDLAGLWTP
jgi:vacuolar-type H+-ATPase subunit E/Vma4